MDSVYDYRLEGFEAMTFTSIRAYDYYSQFFNITEAQYNEVEFIASQYAAAGCGWNIDFFLMLIENHNRQQEWAKIKDLILRTDKFGDPPTKRHLPMSKRL